MATQDIFNNLVKDITEQVLEQVAKQSQVVVATAINQRIDSLVDSNYINRTIEDKINNSIAQYQPDLIKIEDSIHKVVSQLGDGLSTDISVRVNKMVGDKINEIDLTSLINNQINNKINPESLKYPFPDNSIGLEAVDITGLKITGDQVSGGVIKNFGSTGIDDQATECRVTILDQGTVFENTLYTPRIEVKGGALIDGDLEIKGRIVDSPAYQQLVSDVASTTQNSITDQVLQQHQTLIFDRIQNEGIDLNKVTFNGRLLVDGDRLVGVVNSQLRTVGVLQDLQTSGDNFLSDTLYITNKRVGLNTMDPKSALSIWDEEIEFSIGKDQLGVGRIAVEREKSLILGSNNKDNITLKSDGSTVIPLLQINNMIFSTAQSPPSYSARRGTVVFNENPSIGGPLGWVSLGEARWANFGIID
jgi:hypothetical protein